MTSDQEERAFRRGVISKLRVFAFLAVIAFILDVFLGLYFRTGKIMATSQNSRASMTPKIVIREIRRFPLLAFPLATLDDNPQYRFEFYAYDAPHIWSCQSFTGASYTANNAQIEWNTDGSATVYLEHQPYFTCKEGVWSKAR